MVLCRTFGRLRSAKGARVKALLDSYFKLTENQTTVRQELLAGLTTFMTMAYIVVVNPQILSQAGMPVEGVLFATCISAALATLAMGLWANYPIRSDERRVGKESRSRGSTES